jgi:uncharacterized membrane protein
MPLTPEVTIHMSAAMGALITGPVALWARRGAGQHPRLHRAFGYAWVTLPDRFLGSLLWGQLGLA